MPSLACISLSLIRPSRCDKNSNSFPHSVSTSRRLHDLTADIEIICGNVLMLLIPSDTYTTFAPGEDSLGRHTKIRQVRTASDLLLARVSVHLTTPETSCALGSALLSALRERRISNCTGRASVSSFPISAFRRE